LKVKTLGKKKKRPTDKKTKGKGEGAMKSARDKKRKNEKKT